jgi:hypothetical protein
MKMKKLTLFPLPKVQQGEASQQAYVAKGLESVVKGNLGVVEAFKIRSSSTK